MRPLVVSEVFGPTVQGEGPSIGRPCMFLRLGGCNLTCRWCDTAYTWDWKGVSRMAADRGRPFNPSHELKVMQVPEVLAALTAIGAPMLVISGGEPMAQQDRWVYLLPDLAARRVEVEVETNGTVRPMNSVVEQVAAFNVSPKLANSGVPEAKRRRDDVIAAYQASRKAVFKFVASNTADLDEVEHLVDLHGLSDVWVMPEGRTRAEVAHTMGDIADQVVARGWNLTSRLHVEVWDGERGR